jgi:3-deoxy-D-manno-octulosonic-acid transferase
MTFYDLAYAVGLAAAAPYWLIRPKARRKVLGALSKRMGRAGVGVQPSALRLRLEEGTGFKLQSGPVLMIHAVSVGELNATPQLLGTLAAARPDLQFVISTTTSTGANRARELYGNNDRIALIRFPLDFSCAVRRVLDQYRPTLIALMELEVWPNFVGECQRRHIPVLIINGRLTTSSFRGYRILRPFTAGMFRALARIGAQDATYADRFIAVGARRESVSVTGTMKFDTAQVDQHVEGTDELARAVSLAPGNEPIWVCGSTGPGEEAIVLEVYRAVRAKHPGLRLVIVPRKPERFDDVARQIQAAGLRLVRRSRPGEITAGDADFPPVILGDTMGELRKFYALADVVFVGRSMVDLGPRQHGSDMIEPAALGKAVVVGPFTHNFSEAMSQFLAADAVRVVSDASTLAATIDHLLANREECAALGERARQAVRRGQGATARHAQMILQELDRAAGQVASVAIQGSSQ